MSDFNYLFEIFKDNWKVENYKPRICLLKEGEVSRKLYFIKKGCVRMWFNKDGKDVTFQFFFEGQGVSSIESLLKEKPSLFNIETIEDSEILTLRKNIFFEFYNNSNEIKEKVNEIILERLFHYQKLFLSRIKNSPEERYKELVEMFPDILLRVPHHYIASYLGITNVSLSRIRNRK